MESCEAHLRSNPRIASETLAKLCKRRQIRVGAILLVEEEERNWRSILLTVAAELLPQTYVP